MDVLKPGIINTMDLDLQELKSKISSFWDWFTIKEEEIENQLLTNTEWIALDVKEQLQKVHPDIEFEIPFEKKGEKREFIVSADGDFSLFGLVVEICKYAPNYKRWEIVAFRPRLHQKNQVVEMDGMQLDYNDVYFTYTTNKSTISIEVYIKNYDPNDHRYVHIYFLLLDSLIGEFDSVTCIEQTSVHRFDSQKNLVEFPKLLEIIDHIKNYREGE